MKKYLRNGILIGASFMAGNIVGILFAKDSGSNTRSKIKEALFSHKNIDKYINNELDNIRCYMDNLNHLTGDVLKEEIKVLKKRSYRLLKRARKCANPELEEIVFNFREVLFDRCNRLLNESNIN